MLGNAFGGWLCYWKSLYLDRMNRAVIDAVIGYAADRLSSSALMDLWHLGGGAASRIGAEATAFGSREAPFLLSFDTTWTNPADSDHNIAWTRSAWSEMHRFSGGGVYLNFAGFGEE